MFETDTASAFHRLREIYLILFERVSDLVAHLDGSGRSVGVLKTILLNVVYLAGAVLTLEMPFLNRFEFGTAFSALDGAGCVFCVSHIYMSGSVGIVVYRDFFVYLGVFVGELVFQVDEVQPGYRFELIPVGDHISFIAGDDGVD